MGLVGDTVIQARDEAGLDQSFSSGGGEKWMGLREMKEVEFTVVSSR